MGVIEGVDMPMHRWKITEQNKDRILNCLLAGSLILLVLTFWQTVVPKKVAVPATTSYADLTLGYLRMPNLPSYNEMNMQPAISQSAVMQPVTNRSALPSRDIPPNPADIHSALPNASRLLNDSAGTLTDLVNSQTSLLPIFGGLQLPHTGLL